MSLSDSPSLSINEALPLCSGCAGTTTGFLLLKGRHSRAVNHSQKDGTRSASDSLVPPLPNETSLKLGTIAARARGLLIGFSPKHKSNIHTVGCSQNSDWPVNSFIMVVYENLFSYCKISVRIFCPNHY